MRGSTFSICSNSSMIAGEGTILASRTLLSTFSTAQDSSATSEAPTMRPLPLSVW